MIYQKNNMFEIVHIVVHMPLWDRALISTPGLGFDFLTHPGVLVVGGIRCADRKIATNTHVKGRYITTSKIILIKFNPS